MAAPTEETVVVETPPGFRCATCEQPFESKSALHRHLRNMNHQKIDDGDKLKQINTWNPQGQRAKQVRRAMIDHYEAYKEIGKCDIPVLSVETIKSCLLYTSDAADE